MENLAIPATGSETGSVLLRTGKELIRDSGRKSPYEQDPHMVLLAFAPNDEPGNQLERLRTVRAAQDLRPCDPVLPVVGIINDVYEVNGFGVSEALLERPAAQYAQARWFHLFMMDYGAVVEAATFQNTGNEHDVYRLFGSKVR